MKSLKHGIRLMARWWRWRLALFLWVLATIIKLIMPVSVIQGFLAWLCGCIVVTVLHFWWHYTKSIDLSGYRRILLFGRPSNPAFTYISLYYSDEPNSTPIVIIDPGFMQHLMWDPHTDRFTKLNIIQGHVFFIGHRKFRDPKLSEIVKAALAEMLK